jgi:predicted nucleic acid-binding protein
LAEFRVGVEIPPSGKRKDLLAVELNSLLGILFQQRILPFDRVAAEALARMCARERTLGNPSRSAAARLRAFPKVHRFTVATRDTSPFEAAGVAFVNPLGP